MAQLSPLAQFVINEMRDINKEDPLPDHVYVQGLTEVLLADDVKAPPHVVALVKELQAHFT
jgi:hypothetical protein